MKRIIAQARKELTQTFRDRLTLALALALPLAQMWLIGQAVSLSVTDLGVVVSDMDQSPLSRRYAEALRASLTFRVVPLEAGERPENALEDETAHAAVVIPEGFDRDLRRGLGAEVQWLLDGTDANTANIMRGQATAITQAFNAQADEPHLRERQRQRQRQRQPVAERLRQFFARLCDDSFHINTVNSKW
ncbi:MAG TPA: ABC transporter permease [Pyrinomonadaceae bacterium]|nr:ABC transporter permease [Pyrinomonadaceae bacterium]